MITMKMKNPTKEEKKVYDRLSAAKKLIADTLEPAGSGVRLGKLRTLAAAAESSTGEIDLTGVLPPQLEQRPRPMGRELVPYAVQKQVEEQEEAAANEEEGEVEVTEASRYAPKQITGYAGSSRGQREFAGKQARGTKKLQKLTEARMGTSTHAVREAQRMTMNMNEHAAEMMARQQNALAKSTEDLISQFSQTQVPQVVPQIEDISQFSPTQPMHPAIGASPSLLPPGLQSPAPVPALPAVPATPPMSAQGIVGPGETTPLAQSGGALVPFGAADWASGPAGSAVGATLGSQLGVPRNLMPVFNASEWTMQLPGSGMEAVPEPDFSDTVSEAAASETGTGGGGIPPDIMEAIEEAFRAHRERAQGLADEADRQRALAEHLGRMGLTLENAAQALYEKHNRQGADLERERQNAAELAEQLRRATETMQSAANAHGNLVNHLQHQLQAQQRTLQNVVEQNGEKDRQLNALKAANTSHEMSINELRAAQARNAQIAASGTEYEKQIVGMNKEIEDLRQQVVDVSTAHKQAMRAEKDQFQAVAQKYVEQIDAAQREISTMRNEHERRVHESVRMAVDAANKQAENFRQLWQDEGRRAADFNRKLQQLEVDHATLKQGTPAAQATLGGQQQQQQPPQQPPPMPQQQPQAQGFVPGNQQAAAALAQAQAAAAQQQQQQAAQAQAQANQAQGGNLQQLFVQAPSRGFAKGRPRLVMESPSMPTAQHRAAIENAPIAHPWSVPNQSAARAADSRAAPNAGAAGGWRVGFKPWGR